MKNSLLTATILSASLIAISSNAGAMQPEKGKWPYWYAGLSSGVTASTQDDWERTGASGEFDTDAGFGYGVALGYQPTNLRYELEFGAANQDIGTTGSSGDISTYKLMFNVLYDFDAAGFSPFIGAGLGGIRADVSQSNTAAISGDDTTAAWQLIAGLNLGEVLPQTNLHVDYKYLDTFSDLEVGTTEYEYNAHTVEAGLRFRF